MLQGLLSKDDSCSARQEIDFPLPWRSRYNDGLRAGRAGFDSRQGQDFSFLHSVHTDWARPASYPAGTGGKAAGA
jgi:hypothetical protein